MNRPLTQNLQKTWMMVILVLLVASCSKERPEEVVQGQGQNLSALSDYQGSTFTVQTGGSLIDKSASHAESLELAPDYDSLNSFELVSYKTDSPLLQDIPFRGLKNHVYKMKVEVDDEYMVVYKLGSSKEIPVQELTYAKEISPDFYAVPMVGYPISLINLEKIKDANGDETNKKSEFSKRHVNEASYFRFNLSDRLLFDAISKQDVFLSNLFDGQWFYAATIVGANTKLSTSIGANLSADFEAKEVSRIEFKKTKDSLRAVNLNLDDNIDKSDDINFETALEIPVKWVDFRRGKSKSTRLTEEKLDDSHPEAKKWQKRKFVEIDFVNTKSLFTRKTEGKFQDLEISKDYLSFTIFYPAEQVRIKYAFKRAHNPIKPRIYPRDDRKVFGFFTTERHYIENWRHYRKEDLEKEVYLNRFNPANKKIVFHFSSTTPKAMRRAGKRAIEGWNRTFEKAQTGIEVVLDESKDVSLGDIRYNIINIIDTKDGASLLGYGPSIVDTESGEIISATSNIYVNPYRSSLISTLRNYVKSELGLFDSRYLDVSISEESLNPQGNSKSVHFENSQRLYKNLKVLINKEGLQVSEKTKKLAGDMLSFLDKADKKIHFTTQKEKYTFGRQCSYQAGHKDTIKKVQAQCPEVQEYIDQLKKSGTLYNENELTVMEGCAEKLLEENIVATLVHEMGHNFGLRHNFAASADPSNFTYKEEKGKQVPVSLTSSTMDYQPADVDELLEPGHYDVAAISYGYANKVELAKSNAKGQKIVDIKNDTAIFKQISKDEIKKYRFCTDEDVGLKDPLCARHDHGTNPKEVVNNIINSFNSFYATYGSRYDRAVGPNSLIFAIVSIEHFFLPLKQIYDQWRLHLSDFVTQRNQYLQTLSEEDYQKVLEKMKADKGRHGEHYAQYYEASKTIYEFFKSLAFIPTKMCVLNSTKDEKKSKAELRDYEEVRREVFKETGKTVFSCEDQEVKDYFKDQDKEVVKGLGYYFNEQTESLDIESTSSQVQSVGLGVVRHLSFLTLGLRIPTSFQHAREGFFPNFYDIPEYRKEISELLISRITQGLSSKSLGLEKPKGPFLSALGTEVDPSTIDPTLLTMLGIPKPEPVFYKIFSTEKDLLISMYDKYTQSLDIPGELEVALERVFPYITSKTPLEEQIPGGTVYTQVGNFFAYAKKEDPAGKIIQVRNALKFVKSYADYDLREFKLEDFEDVLKDINWPTFEEYTTLTFKQYMERVLTMPSLIAKIQDPVERLFLNYFFDIAYKTLPALLQAVSQSPELQALNDKPAAETFVAVLKANAIEAMKALSTESYGQMLKGANDQMSALKLQVDIFNSQRNENEAQLDMLTRIIL